jgi:hypothetical protein
LEGIPAEAGVPASGSPTIEAARQAILQSIRCSCGARLSEALAIQAQHSAQFAVSSFCKEGSIGAERQKTMVV